MEKGGGRCKRARTVRAGASPTQREALSRRHACRPDDVVLGVTRWKGDKWGKGNKQRGEEGGGEKTTRQCEGVLVDVIQKEGGFLHIFPLKSKAFIFTYSHSDLSVRLHTGNRSVEDREGLWTSTHPSILPPSLPLFKADSNLTDTTNNTAQFQYIQQVWRQRGVSPFDPVYQAPDSLSCITDKNRSGNPLLILPVTS